MFAANKSAYLLLVAGMLAGLTMALVSVQDDGGGGLPEGAVARVDDRYISQEDYARALSAVASDSGQALSDEQRTRVLDRLIDEELLIRYGQDQGLVRSDKRVRANLVSAVIEAKSIAAETRAIADDEARAFYTANAAYFSRPQQFQLTVLRLKDRQDAMLIRQAWSDGATLAELVDNYAVQAADHVPAALLPLGKLRQLLGASLAAAAEKLAAGSVSPPIEVNQQWYLLRMDKRIDSPVAYERIIEQVQAELRRREAEAALREELDALRESLDIVVAEERL